MVYMFYQVFEGQIQINGAYRDMKQIINGFREKSHKNLNVLKIINLKFLKGKVHYLAKTIINK